jgi:hypothetical protein
METVYDSVGRPGIFRNDRFWLAGDHRVEPPLYDQPKVKKLMETSLRAKNDFKMTDFQGFNVSASIGQREQASHSNRHHQSIPSCTPNSCASGHSLECCA